MKQSLLAATLLLAGLATPVGVWAYGNGGYGGDSETGSDSNGAVDAVATTPPTGFQSTAPAASAGRIARAFVPAANGYSESAAQGEAAWTLMASPEVKAFWSESGNALIDAASQLPAGQARLPTADFFGATPSPSDDPARAAAAAQAWQIVTTPGTGPSTSTVGIVSGSPATGLINLAP